MYFHSKSRRYNSVSYEATNKKQKKLPKKNKKYKKRKLEGELSPLLSISIV